VFGVLMLVTFIVAGSSPDTGDSDAKIAVYLAKSSAQHRNELAIFIAVVAILFLVLFLAALRNRIAAVDGFAGHASLAFGAGIASAVSLMVAVASFVSPVVAADDAHPNALDPDIFRLMNDLGFLMWVAAGVFGALAVFAVAAAARRSAAFPAWYFWVSIVLGVISLAAIFFITVFAFWLWALITGILLTVRSSSAAPQPAVA
jgi:hypothetical protein